MKMLGQNAANRAISFKRGLGLSLPSHLFAGALVGSWSSCLAQAIRRVALDALYSALAPWH